MVDSHGKTGFKGCLEAQVVPLLGANNLASMRRKGKPNMLDDPRQYNGLCFLTSQLKYIVIDLPNMLSLPFPLMIAKNSLHQVEILLVLPNILKPSFAMRVHHTYLWIE